VGDEARVASLDSLPGGSTHSLLLAGSSHTFQGGRKGGGVWRLHLRGGARELEVLDPRTRTIRNLVQKSQVTLGPRPLRAPMPGLVVKVEVEEGVRVERGDPVVVVEAMKMENELRAPAAARVTRVHVTPGVAVEKDQVLVEFSVEGGGEDG